MFAARAKRIKNRVRANVVENPEETLRKALAEVAKLVLEIAL